MSMFPSKEAEIVLRSIQAYRDEVEEFDPSASSHVMTFNVFKQISKDLCERYKSFTVKYDYREVRVMVTIPFDPVKKSNFNPVLDR